MYAFPYPHLSSKECLELKLLSFYYDIFQQEMSTKCNSGDPAKYLQELKKYYFQRIIRNKSSDISFDSPQMRCSYIFHFASSFSSIVAHYFSKILHCLPWLTEKILLADEISICCIGGGPGTEIVAIVTILEDMLWRYCPRSYRPLKLKATVLDIDSGWKGIVKKVNETLADYTTLIDCQLSFVQADLTKPLSDEVRNIVSSSDIVTMSKFMTTIHATCGLTDVKHTFQVLFQHIREDGILLFLDSSGFENYYILRDVANSFDDIFQIYGLWEHEVYEMSQTFLKECYRFYSRFYTPYKTCCFRSRNYVSAWHRRKVLTIRSEAFLQTSRNNSGNCKTVLKRSASASF